MEPVYASCDLTPVLVLFRKINGFLSLIFPIAVFLNSRSIKVFAYVSLDLLPRNVFIFISWIFLWNLSIPVIFSKSVFRNSACYRNNEFLFEISSCCKSGSYFSSSSRILYYSLKVFRWSASAYRTSFARWKCSDGGVGKSTVRVVEIESNALRSTYPAMHQRLNALRFCILR